MAFTSKLATPRTPTHTPHSSRNVNVIHHTVCSTRSDVTTLNLTLQRRRPGKYDVPLTSKSIVKLDDVNISKRLRARLSSASRVYCGNNMLTLHRQMYINSRPGSVQYKWSPPQISLALPKIQKEQVRARTAGTIRFRHLDPTPTPNSVQIRPKSYPVATKTKKQEPCLTKQNEGKADDTNQRVPETEDTNPRVPEADCTESSEDKVEDRGFVTGNNVVEENVSIKSRQKKAKKKTKINRRDHSEPEEDEETSSNKVMVSTNEWVESSGHNSLKDSKRRPPSQESDIEVQDWVVQTLGLGDSKLTGKDLDRISTLVSVYCNVSINIKKVLSKYKKEDIFKSVEEKNVKKKGKQATPERRKSDTHNSVPVAPPPDVHVEVQVIIQQSGKQTTSVKELKPEPEIETKPESKSEQVPRASTPVSIHSKPAPSNDFEPTPGCSTDPDPLPRPRSRSDPRPKRRHVHFDPVPGEYDDLPPIRLVTPDLEPALPDLKDEPPRGISIFSNKSGKSIATDTKKVNVDADMMEIALIIYLAKKKKTTALKSLMDSM